MIFVLLCVSFLVHLMIHLVPGDPVDAMVGQRVTQAEREAIRKELGLDDPMLVQYGNFLKRAVQLDFGHSYITRADIGDAIVEKFPRTIYLALTSVLMAVVLGIGAGIVTAAFPRTLIDKSVMVIAVLGVSAPVFVTGLFFQYFFAEKLGLFPPAGGPSRGLIFVVLPALTLGSRSAAFLARITRTTFLEILSEDYIRTAQAKGLTRTRVLLRHALPNVAVPLMSIVLLDLAMYLNGSVITESIFAWPGLGRFALTAILQRDLPSVQAVVLVMAATYVVVMALADVLRVWMDPRLRESGD